MSSGVPLLLVVLEASHGSISNSQLSAISLALSLALMACNTTPSAKNPYANGAQKPWKQAISPQDAKPLVNGFLSDQQWTDASSGWGPVEFDKSNGEDGSGDGSPINIAGQKYEKGLGAHAVSAIKYKLAPANNCTTFTATVGLDDEIRSQSEFGSVTFQVWTDGKKVWESSTLNVKGGPTSQAVSVPVAGKSTLELRVTNGGDDANHQNWYDHADWAEAKIVCATGTTNPPPPSNPPPSNPTNLKIQFEDFKQGGEGVGYHDNDATNQGGLYRPNEGVDIDQRGNPEGYNVGWSGAGEWMKYDLNVGAGTYALSIRADTYQVGEKLDVSVDDVKVLTAAFPNTGGFGTPQVVNVGNVTLSAGAHVLKVAYVGSNPALNLDWMEFVPSGGTPTPPSPTPPGPPPPSPTPPSPTPPSPPPSGPTASTTFTGTDAEFPNPERGVLDSGADLTNPNVVNGLSSYFAQGLRIARPYIRLDDFRNSPLSSDWLARLDQGFDALRTSGMKIALRFSYNFPTDGNYQSAQDAPLNTVLQHIQQIKPILARNADVIAFVQATFMGAWGEWHDSSNGLDSPENKIILRDALLDAVPAGRFLQIRYPIDLRSWNPTAPAESDAFGQNARMGIFNDCYLSGNDDGGSYNGMNDPLRDYVKAVSRVAPFGAEYCEIDGSRNNCGSILSEGRDYSLIYISTDSRLFDSARAGGCYDEFLRSMGYRFRLTSASHPASANRGSTWPLGISVSNDGWARLFNPRAVKVVLRNKSTGQLIETTVSQVDPRRWLPGATSSASLPVNIPAQANVGEYDVLIGLPDAAPRLANDVRYAIRFANADDGSRNQGWESSSGLFRLGTTVTIN
jgi:Domain of unknown function (DUF4832)/NPCBM/NEW2 domain/Domain of unknown function (DUF4874)/Carbohydrate binding module (family 6)